MLDLRFGTGSIVVIPLTVDKAVEAQEGLAKGTYSRLFDHVVQRLNDVVKVRIWPLKFSETELSLNPVFAGARSVRGRRDVGFGGLPQLDWGTGHLRL